MAKRLTLSEHPDDTSPKCSKKSSDAAFAVADALRDMSLFTQHAILSERRIELLEKAEYRQQKEDDRKDREYPFSEWERLRETISRIRKELNAEKDDTIREELQFDIDALLKKKHSIGEKIGLLWFIVDSFAPLSS